MFDWVLNTPLDINIKSKDPNTTESNRDADMRNLSFKL